MKAQIFTGRSFGILLENRQKNLVSLHILKILGQNSTKLERITCRMIISVEDLLKIVN